MVVMPTLIAGYVVGFFVVLILTASLLSNSTVRYWDEKSGRFKTVKIVESNPCLKILAGLLAFLISIIWPISLVMSLLLFICKCLIDFGYYMNNLYKFKQETSKNKEDLIYSEAKNSENNGLNRYIDYSPLTFDRHHCFPSGAYGEDKCLFIESRVAVVVKNIGPEEDIIDRAEIIARAYNKEMAKLALGY